MIAQTSSSKIPTGPAAAAILASAIGCSAIGLLTTGAVISTSLNNLLNWYQPVGSLTGKTGVSVIVWLISWAILDRSWKDKNVSLGSIFILVLILLIIGLILTFPPVFEVFE